MTLLEALQNVARTKATENWANPEMLATAFDLGYVPYEIHGPLNERLKGYYLLSWLCTDTEVGVCAYFLDDELVGYSQQSARKADETLKFISQDAAKKTLAFIQSLIEPDFPVETVERLNETQEPYFRLGYYNQLLSRYSTYVQHKGEYVPVMVKGNGNTESYASTRVLIIMPESGQIRNIPMDELYLKTMQHDLTEEEAKDTPWQHIESRMNRMV